MRFYKSSVGKLELGRPRATLPSVWGKEIKELTQRRGRGGGAQARGGSALSVSSAAAANGAAASGVGSLDERASPPLADGTHPTASGASSRGPSPNGPSLEHSAHSLQPPHQPPHPSQQRPGSGSARGGGGREKAAPPEPDRELLCLHKPAGPENYTTVTAMALADQDAYLGCWLEACLACGATAAAADPAQELLLCMDCGEAYHPACLGVPDPWAPGSAMDAYTRATWRCVNCKLCELCGQAMANEEKSLLQCERCDKGYHMGCLLPPLAEAPADPWYCGDCVRCRLCRKPCPEGSWSCHPEVCYACGGFQEKNAEMRLRCPVCLEVSVLSPAEQKEAAARALDPEGELSDRERRRLVRAWAGSFSLSFSLRPSVCLPACRAVRPLGETTHLNVPLPLYLFPPSPRSWRSAPPACSGRTAAATPSCGWWRRSARRWAGP